LQAAFVEHDGFAVLHLARIAPLSNAGQSRQGMPSYVTED
jgi:hypothetical protein